MSESTNVIRGGHSIKNPEDSDFGYAHSVPPNWTIITKAMYKESRTTFIGLRDRVSDMEVITLGCPETLYRVHKFQKVDKDGFNIFVIRRIDNNVITIVDLEGSAVGDKVQIKNRPSFEQLFNQAYR